MRNYQLVLVLKSSLSDVQRKKVLADIKSLLKDVKVIKEEDWGQKPLAYSVKRELIGNYFNLLLETKGTYPAGFEKKLAANEDILRHLLLKTN